MVKIKMFVFRKNLVLFKNFFLALVAFFLFSASVQAARNWRIEKRDLNGNLIWENSDTIGAASAIVKDASGIYVGGHRASGEHEIWRIEKRSITDGSLIWAKEFDSNGGNNFVTDLAIDGGFMYVVGEIDHSTERIDFKLTVVSSKMRIEKRNLADGSLVWENIVEGTNGKPLLAGGVSALGGNFYVSAFDYDVKQTSIQKRSGANGGLLWIKPITFNCNFCSMSPPLVSLGLSIDTTGIYSVFSGSCCNDNNCGTFQPKLDLNTGNFIWSCCLSTGSEMKYGVDLDVNGSNSSFYDAGKRIENLGDPIRMDDDDSDWKITKRNSSTRALIWEKFSDKGFTWAFENAEGVKVYSSGVYLIGVSTRGINDYRWWQIEKRSDVDGSLIWARDESSNDARQALDLAVDNSGLYIVGYQYKANFFDCGLRVRDDDKTITPACEPAGTLTSPLRIHKNGTTYGIILVDPSDPNASGVKIQTSKGLKALRKYP